MRAAWLQTCFNLIDIDGSGSITLAEFQKFGFIFDISKKACQAAFREFDVDNSKELDFYACMNEFDEGVGTIIAALKRLGYYDNTMIWLTTDNGPEVNCGPEGRCGGTDTIPPGTLHRPDSGGPGSAGPLRGRKSLCPLLSLPMLQLHMSSVELLT